MKRTTISPIQDLQATVDDAVCATTKAQIAQCARLLAIYVAFYKHQFGALTTAQTSDLSDRLGDSVEFGESVYNTALEEFLETLALVEAHSVDCPPGSEPSRTLN